MLMACASVAHMTPGQAGGTHVTVGIALPRGPLTQSTDVAEAMRQSLIGQLRSKSIDAVALTATSGGLPETEAQAKHCNYLLYTRLEQKHGVAGGLFGKLSLLTHGLPNAPLSAEACEKLQGTQQSYARAASDPTASHAGDDEMSCTQILAELNQQQYAAPDPTKLAAANVLQLADTQHCKAGGR